MEKDCIFLESFYNVEVSENNQKVDRLNVKFIICDFGLNNNKWGIERDTFEDWKDTIIGAPVVGKIAKNKDGDDDFTGHNRKKKFVMQNNKMVTKTFFDTEAFGSFVSVDIEEIDGKEYVTATAEIWKRFEKACEIILSRAENNEPLATSWEILPSETIKKTIEGVEGTFIKKGTFIGHALLSKYTRPAYDCSQMLQVAEEEEEDPLLNALMEDIKELNKEVVESSLETNINNKKEGSNRMDNNNVQTSQLNMNDLNNKIRNAIYSSEGNGRWYYNIIIYPTEYVAYASIEGKDYISEDFAKFAYTINSENIVTVSFVEDVKMVFKPKEELETQIAELETKVTEAETKISESEVKIAETEAQLSEQSALVETKNEEICKLNETIQSQAEELKTLEPLKIQAQEAEALALAQEEEAKKTGLKNFVLASKVFTENDIETSEELKQAIESMDEKSVKAIVATKIVENLELKEKEKVQTSELEDKAVVSSAQLANKEFEYNNEEMDSNVKALFEFIK